MLVALCCALVVSVWMATRHVLSAGFTANAIAAGMTMLAPATAAWIAFGLRHRTDIGERTARGWMHIGVASAAATASATLTVVPNLLAGRTFATDLAASVSHYLMAGFILMALLGWVRRLSPAATLGTILDLLCVGLLGYLAVWDTTFASSIDAAGNTGNLLAGANFLAFPALDVLLMVAAVAVLSQIGRHELRGAEVLATFGIVAILASDLRMTYLSSDSRDLPGTWLSVVSGQSHFHYADLGLNLGFIAIAIGAAVRGRMISAEHHVPLIERSTTWEVVWTLVPFLLLAVAIVGWEGAGDSGLSREAFLTLAGLLIARGALAAVHNLRRARTADTDPLTGAFTHSYLQECLPGLATVSRRDGKPLSLLVIDVDDFAMLNESYSHVVGDRFLREMSYLLRTTIEQRMLVFRPGGDEFAIAMPDTSVEQAMEVATNIDRVVSELRVANGAPPSLTMGIATIPDHCNDPHELIALADGARYWGKLNGKRSVTVYDPERVQVLTADERVEVVERTAQLKAVLALARALDARDPSTARHSMNVARYAVAIAYELGWSPEQQELLRIAGLLHDVGKIGVRDSTLRKTSALTEDERDEMKRHPVLSAQLIQGAVPDEVVPWVIGHHERFDGRGYPHELAGEMIPLGARILAVADTFDAMASSRSYRAGLPVRRVLAELAACAGEQFDPDVVRAFLTAIATGALAIDDEQQAVAEAATMEVVPSDPAAPIELELEPEFGIVGDEPGEDVARAA